MMEGGEKGQKRTQGAYLELEVARTERWEGCGPGGDRYTMCTSATIAHLGSTGGDRVASEIKVQNI